MARNRMAALAAALALTALTGCGAGRGLAANYLPIEDLILVETLGLDRGDDGAVLLTASAGGAEEACVLRAGAPALVPALAQLQDRAVRGRVIFAHTQSVVLGQAYAEGGVGDLFDFVERDIHTRMGAQLYVVRGGTAEALVTGAGEDWTVSEALASVRGVTLSRGDSHVFDLRETAVALSEQGAALICALRPVSAGAGAPVVISPDCWSVLKTTLEIWAASGGALDPGLYPLSRAWGFIGGDYRLPSQNELNGLLSAKNTAGILLDEAACAATIPVGTEVSLGAVGKGYTAQAVCDLMADMGVESAILSLGGNVQTLGETKPDGSPWQVAVTDPHDTGAYAGVLTVGQTAAVTSGGYQRYFERDGVTYIHILDPAAGYPVDNDLLSVTVVTEDGALADALSTALFVLGKDGALDFYREQGGFELVLITKDDRVIVTPGLTDRFTETAAETYTYEYLG